LIEIGIMTAKINASNWNTTHYFSENLIAFISLGAEPSISEGDIEIQYHVTLSSKDYEDMYQSSHPSLEKALETLNQKYGDWQLKNLGQEKEDSGCSTCAAH
jgi:hypothetical protein